MRIAIVFVLAGLIAALAHVYLRGECRQNTLEDQAQRIESLEQQLALQHKEGMRLAVERLSEQMRDTRDKVEKINRSQAQRDDENKKRRLFEREYFGGRHSAAPHSTQPAHQGKILTADHENDVHVISLGKVDGVKVGFHYMVARGSIYVATIQIAEVQAEQSSGRAMKHLSKDEIREGDTVLSSQ